MAVLGLGWLPVLVVIGCASSPAPRPAITESDPPAGSHDPLRKAKIEELLGVSYEIFTDDLKGTFRLASQEVMDGRDRFFKDGDKAFRADQALPARDLFESAVRRVADLKQRRAKAWRTLPIFFVELDYVTGRAQHGLAMVAFSRAELDEMYRQLTHMLDVSQGGYNTIAQELQVGVIRQKHPQYRELEGEFADLIVKAHSLLGLECKRRGEIDAAREHWNKALEYVRDDDMRGFLRSMIEGQ